MSLNQFMEKRWSWRFLMSAHSVSVLGPYSFASEQTARVPKGCVGAQARVMEKAVHPSRLPWFDIDF